MSPSKDKPWVSLVTFCVFFVTVIKTDGHLLIKSSSYKRTKGRVSVKMILMLRVRMRISKFGVDVVEDRRGKRKARLSVTSLEEVRYRVGGSRRP